MANEVAAAFKSGRESTNTEKPVSGSLTFPVAVVTHDRGCAVAFYASIIVPTHDRADTLPYALRAALAQSINDIEVIVLGDGCTPQVRRVAETFARDDARVRFLDLPKAPLRGAANRHHAVQAARSERIFYTDDDDLLLPHHVEALGSALDHADVVDTPAVSVNTDGTVMLGVHDSRHPALREMIKAEKLKNVFDTHLAHRKSAYLKGPGAWIQSTDRRVVLHMLKSFANDPNLEWRTIPRITALSFHGMCRLGMPVNERARELKDWASKVSRADCENDLIENGSYSFYAFRLFSALRSMKIPDVSELASGWLHQEPRRATGSQIGDLLAVRQLINREKPDQRLAARVLDDLLEARLGPWLPTEGVIELFLRVHAPETVRALLSNCRNRAAVSLARFHIAAQSDQLGEDDAQEVSKAIETALPWARFFFGHSIARGFLRAKNYPRAWDWIERLVPAVPHSFLAGEYWHLRETVATRLNLPDEGELARQKLRELANLER